MIAKIDKVTNMIEQPDVWLCHRNHDKICLLPFIDDLKIYVTANAVDEVSFSIHKHNNGVEFEYWEQIENLKVVCVDGFGYFEIAVDKQVSDDTKKVITGISTEAELGQIKVYGLEVNGEIDRKDDSNWDSSGNCIPTVIYNSSDTQHSLLHRLLSFAPHWQLGDVNNTCPTITVNDEEKSVSIEHRTFNFDDISVYDALQEIAVELDVVFLFNTVERTINMYNLNTIGEDTTIYVSTENLATDFTCTSNKDSIKNCFKIVGGDDNINAAIRAVNPNGSNYIYHPSPEQMEDMSEGLRTKLTNYEEYFESLKTEYNECCNDLYNAIDDYYNLKTSMMPGKTPDEETDIDKEIAKLTSSKIGNIPVQSLTTLYQTGAEKAILTIAQVMVDYRYEVTINSGLYDTTTHTWTGKFKVTNTSNSTDVAISANDVVLTFVEDEKEYLQDKINELVKDVSVEDVNIEKFKENLTYYALDSLEQFVSIYAECTKELEKYSYKDKVEEEFYELYHSYWEKWQACISERDTRKTQVATAEKNVEKYQEHVDTYHEMLDFEHFMGDYYKEFCLYRREDTYQNDNYISDGLDNSNTLQNAKKLVEVATKELIKASLFQTTYTANLNNLFTNPIYKPFYEHFDLFNWIHAEIDGKQIMLRLIGITFDFSSIEKIEVEFSEQVRNANGITDLQSILGQAKSMATSYSSTVKQAASGQEACLEFDTIKQEGLNSALMNIKNSNNEEVVIDNCGINCRSKDQNDQYDQCQLRITGKNIVMTDDDWRTASMAIGAGSFNGQECYGVWCDVLCGNFVVSEALLIANSSGTFLVDKDGIIVKNMKLDMSNADGSRRIVIDPELDSILSVYTNSKQVFYVDTNGNMCMLGNLYVNNNNMYLKVDMTAENIIEVGYGEITGTGNEGEGGSGEGGVRDTPWVRSSDGLNLTNYDWNYPSKGYADDYSIDYRNNGNILFNSNNVIEKNGKVYMLHDKIIRCFDSSNNTWKMEFDFSSVKLTGYENYESRFVKNDRDDDCLYIFVGGYRGSSWQYCSHNRALYAYNLNTNEIYRVWYCWIEELYYGNNLISSVVIKNNTLYICSCYSAIDSNNKYGQKVEIPYYEDGIYSTAVTTTPSNFDDDTHTFCNFTFYNSELYCMDLNYTTNKASLCKVLDLDTKKVKILQEVCGVNSNKSYLNNFSCVVHNDELFIFPFVSNKSKEYYIYDFSTDNLLTKNDLPPLQTTYVALDTVNSMHRTYYNGCLAFSDGENIHLYNNVSKSQYLRDLINNYNYYAYYYQGNPTYFGTTNHYIYNENNKIEVDKNFKELDNGKNFISTLQGGYCTIGDKIFMSNCTYCFAKNKYDLTNQILCLDTSVDGSGWEVIYSGTTLQIISLIQSNATDKVYFFYDIRGSGYKRLAYYDLTQNKVMYFGSITGLFYDDTNTAYTNSIGNFALHGDYAYLDENTQTVYRIGLNLVKCELSTNTNTTIKSLGHRAISNIIYENDYIYYLANISSEKYALYKIDLSGNLEKLADIPSLSYDDDYGFSIFLYNNKIQVYYSYHGVLSHTRHIYYIENKELKSYDDVFQDLGLYTVNNAVNSEGYKTCFLPMIPTSNGVHIFVGYPWFDGTTYNNGGYKHYLYTESGSTPIDPDNPDNPSTGDVDNPSDKIFYITNEGDGYFYGTVYAKDGKFSGDIYARNLTLGENAVVSGKITSQTGEIGKWIIAENGLISPDFDEYTTGTSGLALYSDGNILNRGLWNGQDNAWYAYLYKGKWVFGLGNYFGATTDEQYSDISANGIYMCSKDTILNKSSQYLFAVDTTNDTVSITNSSSNSPALTITNNYFSDDNSYDAPALVLHSPKQGYRNRPLDVRMRVTGEILGTGQSVDNEYCMQMFGEQEHGRIIFRSSKIVGTVNDDGTVTYAPEGNTADTESSDPLVPSMIGSSTFRWFQGYFMELYSTNGLNTSSDKKIKNHIQDIDANKSLELINSLTPVEYTLKNNANNRKHMGFYAQDVKKTCDDMELGNMSLYAATWHKDGQEQECYYSEDAPDEELQWTLKYEEFIAPLVGAVQALTKRVEDLEADNEKLRTRIEKLEDVSE